MVNDQISGIILTTGTAATGYNFGEFNPLVTPVTPTPSGTPDLVLTQSIDTLRVRPGQAVQLTFNLSNQGNATALNAQTSINLGGLVFESATDANFDPNTGIWSVGNLAAGDATSLTVTANAPIRGSFTASASASAANAETTLANNNTTGSLTSTTGTVTKQSYLSSFFRR